MHYTEIEDTYKCDKCRAVFSAKQVVFKPANTGIKILTPQSPMKFVDKEGNIVGGGHSAREGDQTLHCPKCGQLHLFGFDLAKNG